MKTAWLGCGTLVLAIGCGGGGTDKPANTAGSSAGGAAAGTSSGAGVSNGGSAAQSGSSSGGASAGSGTAGNAAGGATAGSGTGGAGTAGSGTAGSSAQGFTCPAGPFDAPTLTVTPTRIAGVPPADDFNNNNNDFTNIEGAVWLGDALYVSEINPNKGSPPPSRILKITADDKVSIAVPADTGTNGMATNAAGELLGCVHKDGSVSKIALPGGAATPVASMFMGKRFGSPNDLTIHKNGTIYFTDPSYQAPMPNPQSATRVYRVPVGGMPTPFEEQLSQPNGITLSKNQDFLYVAGSNGLKKYPVMADGSVGTGAPFADNSSSDGMTLDCSDNLYITNNGVVVFDSTGKKLGTITVAGLGQTTNVAFGGADHKTLYITGQGSGMQKGLFKAAMNVPGFPY